jgi:hypothetical protein
LAKSVFVLPAGLFQPRGNTIIGTTERRERVIKVTLNFKPTFDSHFHSSLTITLVIIHAC